MCRATFHRYSSGRYPCCFAPSPVTCCVGSCRAGEAGMGVWGKTWNRAVVLRGRGGSGFPPVRFRIGPSAAWYSWSRAVVFLTSPSGLVGGVRSGTRRRRGASASAQAAGGTETETQRAAPAHAGAALYGERAGFVRTLCGPRRAWLHPTPAGYRARWVLVCSALIWRSCSRLV